MAIVGLTTCSRITDYEESLARAGAQVRPLDAVTRAAPTRRSTASTRSC